ncbi:ABC transporter permease [Conexibacter sp. JD483]|uniref:ABC transporter permease n=1 Tax=unclassified Conexibacter TaxID=2627773 RepID=UPI00271752FC|nr:MULTISPECIES: ABC transporter permease [unclassified Conexibacter]MDO8186667.1 ABC transporter permease [Conexibacter sp. CPCC 205706]MDO8200387.1 ABC transporter permease [Conexibacter sp. CPCC 205762]MDR9370591.1 ABC transporter permease [Conexibacter sp. JD483]
MSALTATHPAPSFATLAWRQYRLERRMFWRNPSAAFFNFMLPLLLLAMFGAIFSSNQDDLDVIVPGIAGMSVVSTTFSALAYNMTAMRENGVMKRMRGTPMPSGAYLLAIAGHSVTNTALQMVLIIGSGKLFFGVDWPPQPVELLLFVLLGVVCFASLGVALSHVIPNNESAPAYVNAIFLPLIIVSGVFYDAADVPSFLAGIAQALPLTHLIDGLSAAMVTGSGIDDQISSIGVIVAWTVFGVAFAIRGFSWEARRN